MDHQWHTGHVGGLPRHPDQRRHVIPNQSAGRIINLTPIARSELSRIAAANALKIAAPSGECRIIAAQQDRDCCQPRERYQNATAQR